MSDLGNGNTANSFINTRETITANGCFILTSEDGSQVKAVIRQDLVTIITYGGPIMVLAEGEIAPDGPVNYSEQFEKDDELETSVLVYKDGEFVIKQPFGPASNEPVSLHTTNGDVQVLRGYDHNGQNAFFVLNEGDEIPAGEVRYDWTCSSGHSHWTAGTVGEVNETERPHWTFKKGPSNDKPNITAMVF